MKVLGLFLSLVISGFIFTYLGILLKELFLGYLGMVIFASIPTIMIIWEIQGFLEKRKRKSILIFDDLSYSNDRRTD